MIMIVIYILIFLFCVFLIDTQQRELTKRKELGDLTGKYITMRNQEGLYYKVEYRTDKGLKYRIASNEDIKVLIKYKYI